LDVGDWVEVWGISHKLAADGEGQASAGDELGLASRAVVEGAAVLGRLGQAAFGEERWRISEIQMPTEIHGRQVVFAQEAKRLQPAGLQQRAHQRLGDALERGRIDGDQIVVQCSPSPIGSRAAFPGRRA